MIDRNVEFPNRFQLQKVEGTDDIYDIIPAPGDVIAPGDLFSKGNMLPDEIVSLLGLKMANPQVKDALNVLAHVGNLHVWERVQTYSEPVPEVPAGYTFGEETSGDIYVLTGNTQSAFYVLDVTYGDSVSVDKNGNVSIVSPTTKTSVHLKESEGKQIIKSLVGKYVTFGEPKYPNYVKNVLTGVFYIPPTATVTVSNSGASTTYLPVIGHPYTPAIPAGTTTDYLTSTDRNAYPDQSAEGSSYLLGEPESKQVSEYYDTGTTRYLNLSYSDSVVISGDGSRVELNNPTTVEIGANASANFNVAKGKFCKFFQTSDTSVTVSITDLVFIPSDAEFSLTYPNSRYTVTCSKVQSVTVVSSTITYLGQLGEGARIEVGSYVGTGTYGSSNPCSVTARFPIKQLSVFGEIYTNTGNYFPTYQTSGYSSYSMHDILLTTSFASHRGIHDGTSNYSLDYSFGKKSADGKTFWWYSSGNAASFQLNESGSIYYYIAIG